MVESSDKWQTVAMDAILSLLWFLPSLVFGVGTVVTLVAIRRAPAGTEDEDGFVYQHRTGVSLEARERRSVDTVPPMGARVA
jgi:cytochrome c-type biogenesis protein CcmH/NrfF